MTSGHERLVHHTAAAFRQACASLTGSDFSVDVLEKTPPSAEAGDAIVWQQSFASIEGPALWIVAGKDLWESMAHLTLESAGIDTVTDEDSRSTWQEIVGQTIAGIAAGISEDVLREVSAGRGQGLDAEPAGMSWIFFSVIDGANRAMLLKVAWSRALTDIYEPRNEEAQSSPGRESNVSKTFDLLLEVALPVSVSFGRTSLQVREVLKLNTGSIVELNRLVSDPVEVIVNDCVIARGEVVVVDGNYGVRINQLASREDRLRTGMRQTTGMAAHA